VPQELEIEYRLLTACQLQEEMKEGASVAHTELDAPELTSVLVITTSVFWG
jgi:hypothetical protein